jgi:hypothetical protein
LFNSGFCSDLKKIEIAVGDSAKKYKMAISSLSHQNFKFFGQVPQSPTHTGLFCAGTPEPNISSFKGTGSPDGLSFGWHVWIGLGLNKRRGWFLNCSRRFLLK